MITTFENDGEYEVMIIIATMSDNNERSMAAGAAVASGCLRCSECLSVYLCCFVW